MSNWKEIYDKKITTPEEAVKLVKSGDRIYTGNNISMPIALLETLAERKDELENVSVYGGTCLYPFKILESDEYRGKINFMTNFLAGYELANKGKGNVGVTSVHFSRLGEYFRENRKCNVIMTQCSAPDENGMVSFGVAGISGAPDVIDSAERVILSINHNQAYLEGDKYLYDCTKADAIVIDDTPLGEFPQGKATEEEMKMVDYILPYIQDGATIQLGLGGLPNEIGFRLESRKNLSVHTEMYTDSMCYLAKKGVITGKQTAAFALGSKEMLDYVASGAVEFRPISYVNDPYVIGQLPNVISINACLMADITGQVCSEAVINRQYSGTGGQLDFVRGAALSKGGKSFLCMTSTVKDKKTGKLSSKIKAMLPEGSVVTTPRADVQYIVTEYGVADLWLKPIEERAAEMIKIAHPDFREQLLEEAIANGIIRRPL